MHNVSGRIPDREEEERRTDKSGRIGTVDAVKGDRGSDDTALGAGGGNGVGAAAGESGLAGSAGGKHCGCVVPIMMGVIAAFGVDKRSNIAAGIMIVVAQGTSIWNVGIQTAAAYDTSGKW